MAEVVKFPTSSKAASERTLKSKREGHKVNLTEARIEKLPVTGKTHHILDGMQPGLSVRISAGGVKAYLFTKFKSGRFTQITLGRVGAMRLDAARKAAQMLHGEIAMGVDVGAKRKAAGLRQAQSETMGKLSSGSLP